MGQNNVIGLTTTATTSGTYLEITIPDGIGGYISRKIPFTTFKDAVNLENSPNKGYFATEADLIAAFPSGENGWYAIVGDTDTVWIWDDDTAAWIDTSNSGLVISVNGNTGTVVLAAVDIAYSSLVGLSATNVRDGIDELKNYIDSVSAGAGGIYVNDVRSVYNVTITNPTTTITFTDPFLDTDYTPIIQALTGNELLDTDNIVRYTDRIEIPSSGTGELNCIAVTNTASGDIQPKYIDSTTDIYIDAAGNDDTGDGTIGTPYLTINRGLQDIGTNATIAADTTIHQSADTFLLTNEDQVILNSIKIIDNGSLNFEGELIQEETGLTLTPDGSNPFLYDITGGTLTLGANKGHLILEGSDYYPIHDNTTTQLTAQDRIGSSIEIWSISTTIQLENKYNLALDTFAYLQNVLNITNVIIDSDITIRHNSSYLNFENCNVNGDLDIRERASIKFQSGSIFGRIISYSFNLFLQHFNIDNDGGSKSYCIQGKNGEITLRGGILANPVNNICLHLTDTKAFNNNTTSSDDSGILFMNATSALYMSSSEFNSKLANTVHLDTITNIVDSDNYTNISLIIPTLSGSPSGNIRADASTDYIELVDKTYINVDSAETNVRIKNELIVEERSKAGANSISYSAIVSVDFNLGDIHEISQVTGNLTVNTTDVQNGQTGVITFTIDSTGGYTIASGSGTWQIYDDSAYDFADCNTADTEYHIFYLILNSTIYYSIQAIT